MELADQINFVTLVSPVKITVLLIAPANHAGLMAAAVLAGIVPETPLIVIPAANASVLQELMPAVDAGVQIPVMEALLLTAAQLVVPPIVQTTPVLIAAPAVLRVVLKALLARGTALQAAVARIITLQPQEVVKNYRRARLFLQRVCGIFTL